jgi:hypothetical protein
MIYKANSTVASVSKKAYHQYLGKESSNARKFSAFAIGIQVKTHISFLNTDSLADYYLIVYTTPVSKHFLVCKIE